MKSVSIWRQRLMLALGYACWLVVVLSMRAVYEPGAFRLTALAPKWHASRPTSDLLPQKTPNMENATTFKGVDCLFFCAECPEEYKLPRELCIPTPAPEESEELALGKRKRSSASVLPLLFPLLLLNGALGEGGSRPKERRPEQVKCAREGRQAVHYLHSDANNKDMRRRNLVVTKNSSSRHDAARLRAKR